MNVAKLEKESMIDNLKILRAQNPDKTEDINKIISFIKKQKYGLNFEQHTERVDEELKTNLPVLQEREKIQNGQDNDYNFLIEGDNLVALKLLEKTHKGRIGVIYIDPPYNTLKDDFAYDDKMVDESDLFAHSKWLSFMKERLEIAQQLLADDGVIFISIDDREQAQLKLLCDKVFQKENFIDTFIWEKNPNPTFLNNYSRSACEYIICYAKNKSNEGCSHLNGGIIASDETDAPLQNKGNPKRKIHIKANISECRFEDCVITKGMYGLVEICNDVIIKNHTNVNDFDIIGTFRLTEETLYERISNGEQLIFKSKKMAPRLTYTAGVTQSAPLKFLRSSEYGTTQVGNNENKAVFGENVFDNPKPVTLIKKLISFVETKSPIVLDFFAGSGTTAQAVLELNTEANIQRNFILCTNNELGKKQKAKAKNLDLMIGTPEYEALGICRAVTYPRIKTVITGIKPDGTRYSDGLPVNLKYMQTAMIPKYDEQGYIRNELRGEVSTYTEALIELKDAINLPDHRVAVIWDKIGLDELMGSDLKNLHTIYMDTDSVMLNAKQEKFISKMQSNGVQILNIPKYYYKEVQ